MLVPVRPDGGGRGLHQRMMPEWYVDKVDCAYRVFKGNPDVQVISRPAINNSTGVQSGRRGGLGWGVPRYAG